MKRTLDLNSLEAIQRKYAHVKKEENLSYNEKNYHIHRFSFLRKTMFILCSQIIFTILLIFYLMSNEKIVFFIQKESLVLFLVSLLAFAISCLLFFKRDIARTVPFNYVLLIVFTFCEAYFMCFYLNQIEDVKIIQISFGITIGITIMLYLYVLFAKDECSNIIENGIIYSFVSYISFFGIFTLQFGIVDNPLNLVYNFIGCLFYAYAILNDCERILKDRNFDCDDYIVEAMMFYIHVFNLFYKILRIMVAKKKN